MSPTEQNLSLTAWLDVLGAVFQPRGTLVVGAGNGAGPVVQWLRQRRAGPVWLVEGDDVQYQHLRRNVGPDEGWVLRHDVVADLIGPVSFYRASNPAESGLIEPEQLHALWPHLTATHVQSDVSAVTLDRLAREADVALNWLVLDCMPAAALLRGGAELLAQADVVLVRVAVDDLPLELSAQSLGVNTLLVEAGLSRIKRWPLRHPALEHNLYVRNVRQQKELLRNTYAEVDRYEQLLADKDNTLKKYEISVARLVDDLNESKRLTSQLLGEQREAHTLKDDKAQMEFAAREAEWRRDLDRWQQRAASFSQTRAHCSELEADMARIREELSAAKAATDAAKKSHEMQIENISSSLSLKIGSDTGGASKSNIRERNRSWLLERKKHKNIFIDCGGYDGCSAIKFLLAHDDFDVVSFEPNPELWHYYSDIPTKLIKNAVASSERLTLFAIDSFDGDGSSYIPEKIVDNTGNYQNHQCPRIVVECNDVSSFIQDASEIYDSIVLKLDVEGAEYEIISKLLEDRTVSLLTKLFCEFHWSKIDMDETIHHEILQRLREHVLVEEWNALDFSIHGKKSATLKKIRTEILNGLRRKMEEKKAGKND